MLNNNPNPLRAAYPELGNRTAMEALQSPAIPDAAVGLPVFTGPGGVAEAKTVAEALQALGIGVSTSASLFVPSENATGYWITKVYGACISHIFNTRAASAMTANAWIKIGMLDPSVCPSYFIQIATYFGSFSLYPGGDAFVRPNTAINADTWLYGCLAYIK